MEIAHLVSHSYAGQDMNQIYKNFEGKFSKTLDPLDIDMLIEDSDCIFTSLPHSAGGEVIAQLYNAGKTVIDLSGDYRYNDAAVYEKMVRSSPSPSRTAQKRACTACPNCIEKKLRNQS